MEVAEQRMLVGATGWGLTAEDGPKGGDFRQHEQHLQLPLSSDHWQPGRVLLLCAARLHVAQESGVAQECTGVLDLQI